MDALSGFSEAAAFNFVLHVVFRLSTFILNAALLRYVSKDVLGIANVRLMLLYTTLSFLAREPFRKACLSSGTARDWKRQLNVMWFCPVIAILLGVALSFIWIHALAPPPAAHVEAYRTAVWLFASAIMLECLVEPLWILAQTFLMVRFKAVAEGLFYFSRSIFCFIFVAFSRARDSDSFGYSMVAGALVYVAVYLAFYLHLFSTGNNKLKRRPSEGFRFTCFRELLPSPSAGFDWNLVSLCVAFLSHSAVKQFLTEGERFVMTFTGVLVFAEQGVFDVVNNLGSLIARLVFAPLEESAYAYFSVSIQRGVPVIQQDRSKFDLATMTLKALLKFVVLVGMLGVGFGVPYSFTVLKLYGGDSLTLGSGPTLLRCYCGYLLLLAINGISECFCFAVMTKEQVNRHQRFMILFCCVFLLAAYVLTKSVGSVGFLLANYVNMFCRILYSMVYIFGYYRNYDKPSPLWSLLPSPTVLFTLLFSFVVTSLSNLIFCCDGVFNTVTHIAIGALLFALNVLTIYNQELELVNFVWEKIVKPKLKIS